MVEFNGQDNFDNNQKIRMKIQMFYLLFEELKENISNNNDAEDKIKNIKTIIEQSKNCLNIFLVEFNKYYSEQTKKGENVNNQLSVLNTYFISSKLNFDNLYFNFLKSLEEFERKDLKDDKIKEIVNRVCLFRFTKISEEYNNFKTLFNNYFLKYE